MGRLRGFARCDAQRDTLRAQADAVPESGRAATLASKDRAAIEAGHRAATIRLPGAVRR